MCSPYPSGLGWVSCTRYHAALRLTPLTVRPIQRTEQSSTVSAAAWTDGPWPFTIDRGELTCIGPEDDPGVFIVTHQDEIFALNPAAILMADQIGAMADLDPIWRDNPDIIGAKVNVSPIILYALALC